MGPGQLGTWNKVKAPSMMTEGMQPGNPNGSGFGGSAYMPSKEEPQRAEQAGGMKSEKTNHKMIAAGSARSKQIEPPADPDAHMLRDGGKY